MKIYISTLLLAIKVFLLLDEIHASGVQGASSSSGTARKDMLTLVEKYPENGKYDKIVSIGDQKIEVWLDHSKKYVVKAWYEQDCKIPKPDYFKKNDCLIRVFIREGLILVTYISKDNVLIGVRGPQLPGEQIYPLEPTPSLFYLIHAGYTFKVEFNIITERATAISLVPENYPQYYQHETHLTVAGLQFTVFRGGPQYQIMGAELGFVTVAQMSRLHMSKRVKIEHVKSEY